eukprot:s948_g9.t1
MAECLGQPCEALLEGAWASAQGRSALAEVAISLGVSGEEATRSVQLLSLQVRRLAHQAAVPFVMEHPMLSIGCRSAARWWKSGELFVSAVRTIHQTHPELGWTYKASLQQDVTKDVSVADVLLAATKGEDDLARLQSQRLSSLPCGALSSRSLEYLHGLASDMWRQSLSSNYDMSQRKKPRMREDTPEGRRSLASVSTACSLSHATAKSRKCTKTGLDSGYTASEEAGMLNEFVEKQETRNSTPDSSRPEVGRQELLQFQLPWLRLGPVLRLTASANTELQLGFDDTVPTRDGILKLFAAIETHPEGGPRSKQSAWWVVGDKFKQPAKEDAAKLAGKVVADPSWPHCPIVLVSQGFSKFSERSAEEILGTQLASLGGCGGLGPEVSLAMEHLLRAAHEGKFLPEGLSCVQGAERLSAGEVMFSITGGMVILKQVLLDDAMFVIGVMDKDEDEMDLVPRLGVWLDVAVTSLAAEFFYSAPLRRQVAEGSDGIDAELEARQNDLGHSDIAKDDDQKPSQNNQAGHFDDVYQSELKVDGWDGDWLDAWRSAAWLFDKRIGEFDDKNETISWPIFFGKFTRPRRPGTPRDFPHRLSL